MAHLEVVREHVECGRGELLGDEDDWHGHRESLGWSGCGSREAPRCAHRSGDDPTETDSPFDVARVPS
jgi:hypothetical protein